MKNYTTFFLDETPWIGKKDLQELLEALGDGMIVGGAVRNAIMGLPTTDIDIATRLMPDEVSKIAKKNGFKVFPTGISHGTVTCVKQDSYEVTTLRVDEETDGRHAKVRFSDSWKEDAERRDFTINALYSTFDGEIHDYVGGKDDIKQGLVKFIGEPQKRICEDYLRILRFFRFYTIYGISYDQTSFDACLTFAENLKNISRERCTAEFIKILKSKDPIKGLSIMHQSIFEHAGLPVPNLELISYLLQQEKELQLKPSYLAFLASFPNNAELVLSKNEKNLSTKLRSSPTLSTKRDYAAWINSAPAEIVNDGFLLNGRSNKLIPEMQEWIENKFPVMGADLLKLGLPSGKGISECLDELKEYFCSQDKPTSKEKLIAQCEDMICKYKEMHK